MLDEAARIKSEKRWVGKRVYIKRGYYAGHWGEIVSAESETSFVVRGGTLGGLEPLVEREDFRLLRGGEYVRKD